MDRVPARANFVPEGAEAEGGLSRPPGVPAVANFWQDLVPSAVEAPVAVRELMGEPEKKKKTKE